MWRKVGQILVVITIWAAIIAYVCYSTMLVVRHNQEQRVEHLEIRLVDSTASGQLITTQRVREMLFEQNISTIGVKCSEVNTEAIKQTICRHGFVADVDIYASYSGTLHINISQKTPLLRLRVDGYDAYVTEDGFVFASPQSAALYVPVVSGKYRPLFVAGYEGELKDVLQNYRNIAADSVKLIGEDNLPIREREKRLKERRIALRDSSVHKSQLSQWRAERNRLYKNIDGHLRDCQRDYQAVAARQQAVKERLSKVEVMYNDFLNLIATVKMLQKDKFYRAEIVQIVASQKSDGALWLTFIPRSGSHRIEFGYIEQVEHKLDKLRTFYDKVAVTTGWDNFESVNLNYADRIVCSYKQE